MGDFVSAVLVAGVLLCLGFAASQWLSRRFQANLVEDKNRAYRDAYLEAQKKLADDFKKQDRARQERENDELRQTGAEDIKTYEESLRNLGWPQDKIEEALKARHRI